MVLLVGLVGGVALGAIAAARRTQSAFPSYLRASHASDLQVLLYHLGTTGGGSSDVANFAGELAHLRGVAHVSTAPVLFVTPTDARVSPAIADADVSFVGSEGGAYQHFDRPAVVAGTMADPSDPNEIVASTQAASLLGWHVGERIALAAYSEQQVVAAPSFPPPGVAPSTHVTVTLVGLVVFANQIAHDDVDRFPTYVLATPALTSRLASSAGFPNYDLSLVHGSADVSSVENEILRYLPGGSVYQFHVTSVVAGQVERATRPESIALAVFGLIAALAALLVGVQALRREVWSRREESEVIRALGADRATRVAGMTIGALGAVVLGAVVAIGVAVALSPLAPLGAVRTIEPTQGSRSTALCSWPAPRCSSRSWAPSRSPPVSARRGPPATMPSSRGARGSQMRRRARGCRRRPSRGSASRSPRIGASRVPRCARCSSRARSRLPSSPPR